MARFLVLLATVLAGACSLHGFAPPEIVTTRALPIEIAYREGPGGVVLIPGRINGKSRHDFILDTGAPVTVFLDGPRTASLGFDTSNAKPLGPADETAVPRGVIRGGNTVAFDGVELRALTAVVVPRRTMPCPEKFEAAGFDGIVGADLFRAFVVEIDARAKRLRLHDPKRWRAPAGARSVPLSIRDGHVYLEAPLELPGGIIEKADIHLDTGQNRALTLNAGADPLIRFPKNGVPKEVCGVSGARESRVGPRATLRLAGLSFSDDAPVYFRAGDGLRLQKHGAIGMMLFQDRRIAIDYPGQRLFLLD